MTHAADYVRAGFALVPIPKGEKGPVSKGWNLRENAITTVERAAGLKENIGLAHAWSGTCVLDLDDLAGARAFLADHFIDLDALYTSATAVRIVSGRPNRAKLLYRLPNGVRPLQSKKVAGGALELRCATSKGTTVQDVLPPSVHPGTGKPYYWEYGDELTGDWRSPPTLPADVLELWQSLITPDRAPREPHARRADDARLAELLDDHDPDAGYDDWLRVGMALHYETAGDEDGFELWAEWSERAIARDIASRDKLRMHWDSFGNHPNPVTLASLRVAKAASLDDFDDVSEPEAAAPPETAPGSVPKAQHLCTDQANAGRIRRKFGSQLISVNGRFHYWTGRHWAFDEGEAYRCAGQLSRIVKAEAARAAEKAEQAKAEHMDLITLALEHPRKHPLNATPEGAAIEALMTKADALNKWSARCEMKAVTDAALGLLRKFITVDHAKLDADPWALNCANGTVDLRSGVLREHRPEDWITQLAPVDYDPDAAAPRFEQFINEITAGDNQLARFLQRWFGYCATASVREQKFVIHIGQGSNGKGTLLDLIASVLGDYAGTAPPGLLAAGKNGSERHPTEIAELFGKRVVTAHESDDGAVLREGFVKQLTGGDRLKARWMRKDFFEFAPTHKVQLLTNHKPQIKGQDYAIWRRVLLVPYPVLFGSEDDVAAGRATALRDDSLPEALASERAGVLRWIVEGATAWNQAGLNPPDCVLAAGAEYKTEQDRVGQFVSECCETGRDKWAPLSGEFGGLYTAYSYWCRESGYQALGKGKFTNELERVVPFFDKVKRKLNTGLSGARREVAGCKGLRLVEADG